MGRDEIATAYWITEGAQGKGLRPPFSSVVGQRQLERLRSKLPLEGWAGPVLNAEDTARALGVLPLVLEHWTNYGLAICLPDRGGIYPAEQFVGGRPIEGLGAVVAIVGLIRECWLFMRQRSGLLDGLTPLDALKVGRLDDTLIWARRCYSSE